MDRPSRRLRQYGIGPRHPFPGPLLTPRHRNNRLIWARRDRHWQRRDWACAMFSDESRFPIFKNVRRQLVYQRFGERLAPNCVQQVRPFGNGGLMVWGGICGDVKITFVVIRGNLNAKHNRHDILRSVVMPFLQQHPR